MAGVRHKHLYGLRKHKYDWLLKNNVESTKWEKIEPKNSLDGDEGMNGRT